jgi:predicted RNA-binding Zn-ribbon protein involved in translation (DUF1610 family)
MRLLPSRPSETTVFIKDNAPDATRMEPYVVGDGVLDFNCGSCGQAILRGLMPRQVTQAVYKCPKCGKYNQIEPYVKRH